MARLLSDKFMNDLLLGELKELLDFVKKDNSLDLEIREDSINIYYRGGSALKVERKKSKYEYDFNVEYLVPKRPSPNITELLEKKNWFDYFSIVKQHMDFYFTKKRCEEREYQQILVRDNNYSSIANSTDFFIIDIEYAKDKARFDIIALEWPSDASIRKLNNGYKPKLVVMEMKYGDAAISGSASIEKHMKDFDAFYKQKGNVSSLKNEMLKAFKQKRQLGLIPCLGEGKNENEVKKIDENVYFAFILANHDPASSKLKKQLQFCTEKTGFIVSTFTGFGIYKNNYYLKDNFCEAFSDKILEK
jgi:hypothetical protein